MKLARCTDGASIFWAAVDPATDSARLIRGEIADWGPDVPFTGVTREMSALQLLAPLSPGASVVGAGATYAKHIADIGLTMPKQPAAFLKPHRSIVGPGDNIGYP